MADDPSSVPPERNRINVRNVRVQRSTVRDAHFSRADIKTGEIKSVQGDVLSEIQATIEEQTQTLGRIFEKEIQDCCKQIAAGGGPGRGGGGGGGGGTPATNDKVLAAIKEMTSAVRSLGPQLAMGGGGEGGGGGDTASLPHMRRVQKLSEFLEKNTESLGVSMEQFKAQFKENVSETIGSFNTALIKLMNNMTRWDNVTDTVMSRWNKNLELASTGIADFEDLFVDDLFKLTGKFGTAGDSLLKTAETVQQLTEEGITSPLRLVQGNVRDVALEFERLRDEAEDFGLDLYARVGFEEQNKLLTRLIDQQRRGSIQDDFFNMETRRTAMEQADFLKTVADNTGRSLEELVKQSTETAKTFEELQALGILTNEEAAAFQKMSDAQPQMRDFLLKIAESGGNLAVFASKNTDLAEQLVMMNAQHLIPATMEIAKSGRDGVSMGNNFLKVTQDALGDVSGRFGQTQAALLFQGKEIQTLIGDVNQSARLQEDMARDSTLARAYNKVADFFTNVFPIEMASMTVALGANTIALWLNTRAQYASARARVAGAAGDIAPGGGGKGKGAGKGGFLRKAGRFMGGAARIGGSVLGATLVAKDVFDLAQGDVSGENTGALVGSAVGGLLGAGVGALAGGVGAVPGAAIGAGIGNWLGGMAGGALSAGESVEKTLEPRRREGARAGGGTQQAIALQMSRQTELLSNINMKMERSIGVQERIASGVGKIGFETTQAAGKAQMKTMGGDLFAKSPPLKS